MTTPQTTHWDGCATDGGPAHYECAVGRIRELEAELARVREDRDALRRVLNRLPPYDADGFYIDHGEHGKQPVSVADVMDSLRGAVLALDAARGKGPSAMADLQRHPILRAIYDVMQAIERCGASPELTEAVVLAGRLSEQAATILDERDAAQMRAFEVGAAANTAKEELTRVRAERDTALIELQRARAGAPGGWADELKEQITARHNAEADLARVREERDALLATVRRLVNLLHEAKAHLEKRPMSMCVMSPDRLRDSIASELAAIYARSASRSSGSGS